MKSVKSLNGIIWATEYWLMASLCQTWLTNTKPFFWKSKPNLGYLQNLCSYIGVSYRLVLNSTKDRNGIFSVIQGFIMLDLGDNYKNIFLEKQGKPWNSTNHSSFFGNFYKFPMKTVLSVNWIFWVIEYCFYGF